MILLDTACAAPEKGQRTFINAADKFLRLVSDARFVIVGGGERSHVGHRTKASCSSAGGAETTTLAALRRRPFFLANLLGMIGNLFPRLLLGLLAAAVASVLIGKDQIEQWMGGGVSAYAVALAAGIPAYVCEGGEVPLTAALDTMGVGIRPAFTFRCKPP